MNQYRLLSIYCYSAQRSTESEDRGMFTDKAASYNEKSAGQTRARSRNNEHAEKIESV